MEGGGGGVGELCAPISSVVLFQAFINTAKEIYQKIQDGVFDVTNEVSANEFHKRTVHVHVLYFTISPPPPPPHHTPSGQRDQARPAVPDGEHRPSWSVGHRQTSRTGRLLLDY